MRNLLVAVMAAAFIMSSNMIMAADVKCTVDSVDDSKVVLTCKKADKLETGQMVKVKSSKKKAYEGC